MDENPYQSPKSVAEPEKPGRETSGAISWFHMVMFGGCAWLALCSGMLLMFSRQTNSALMAGVLLGSCGAVYAWQRRRR